jgi:TonB family protein
MNGLTFAEASTPVLPRHDSSMLTIAAVVHVVLFALLVQMALRPPRLSSAGSAGSIAAYISGSVGTAGTTVSKPAVPKKSALTTKMAKAAPKEDESAGSEQAGVTGAGQPGGGPVRLGSSGSLTLIKKVQPIYPPLMQSAHMTGQVVLDAIIHPDGTIGDITVLRSTNDAFTQSAVAAVKQWRYAAPGFEGILTVSVNFTLT